MNLVTTIFSSMLSSAVMTVVRLITRVRLANDASFTFSGTTLARSDILILQTYLFALSYLDLDL